VKVLNCIKELVGDIAYYNFILFDAVAEKGQKMLAKTTKKLHRNRKKLSSQISNLNSLIEFHHDITNQVDLQCYYHKDESFFMSEEFSDPYPWINLKIMEAYQKWQRNEEEILIMKDQLESFARHVREHIYDYETLISNSDNTLDMIFYNRFLYVLRLL
jgi:hypothetical protein